jgi:hypothetical protein
MPATFSSWRRITLSAISEISRMGRSALTARYSTGVAPGSSLVTVGCSISLGRLTIAVLTRSRTSWAATSMSLDSWNWM